MILMLLGSLVLIILHLCFMSYHLLLVLWMKIIYMN